MPCNGILLRMLKNRKSGFPIVGIGASAGGLEALEGFLHHLPMDTGMAFVFVQHLMPGHPSLLVELLPRSATIPVSEAQEGDVVKPDHLYVIPPNANLTIAGYIFHVTPRKKTKGHTISMPVDTFFISLAKEHRQQSIGIILSGSASDGTLGMKTIKAYGGLTFAQNLDTAKFNGMPESAINSGSVDFILTPQKIAKKLAKMAQHPRLTRALSMRQNLPLKVNGELQDVFAILKKATGVDFSFYKSGTILRRIQRRLILHRKTTLRDYLKLLRGNPGESQLLLEDFLIHVTSFFRDPPVFKSLKENVFQKILKGKSSRNPCRIWVPGCSTGEEAYSIAIGLLETSATPPPSRFSPRTSAITPLRRPGKVFLKIRKLPVFPRSA